MDKKMQNKKKLISIKFIKSKEYKIFPANGVWGGITPRGNFKMDFFIDHVTIPSEVVHEIEPGDMLGKEIERKTESPFTREIMCGILLTPEQAKDTAKWILKKVEDFEKIIKGKK